MLSIGKMVARSEEYYIRTAATGREEYYTGSGESPGYWIGQGAQRLGLAGEVAPGDLRLILAGISPNGEILTAGRVAEARRVSGFDLTWSTPKSVSLLYGLSDHVISGRSGPYARTPWPRPSATSSATPSWSVEGLAENDKWRRTAWWRPPRASDLALGRPAAPHPHPRGQRSRGTRRHLVGA